MIKMSEFAKRRRDLLRKIGTKSIVIIPTSKEILRNGDATFPFRQNSDFFYLTGFNEPESVMVLVPKRKEGEYILFNRPRDREHEIWSGVRAGQEGALKHYLADQSFHISELPTMLPKLMTGCEEVHYPIGLDPEFDQLMLKAFKEVRSKIRSGSLFPTRFVDINQTLHELRLFKTPIEVSVIQKAIDITKEAHIAAMSACRPGMYEYELEAILQHVFLKNGARSPAYSSIVGAAGNSCILHYTNNDQKIVDGDIVLIDAGAEYQHYAADITRSFPANGKFSPEQSAIYELVLEAQLAAIKTIKPGASWHAPQEAILQVITQGLVDLGILKGRVDDLIEKQAYFPFYMHRSGHWLGLDVHDVGRYTENGKWRNLKAGMLLTVEPGIYITEHIPGVHKRWHNIGVRIEDDVLVTVDGYEVLSKAIPKKIDEIEAIMAK